MPFILWSYSNNCDTKAILYLSNICWSYYCEKRLGAWICWRGVDIHASYAHVASKVNYFAPTGAFGYFKTYCYIYHIDHSTYFTISSKLANDKFQVRKVTNNSGKSDWLAGKLLHFENSNLCYNCISVSLIYGIGIWARNYSSNSNFYRIEIE